MKGNLDIEIFEKAWNALIQRHESLRTYFIEIDGEPYQKIESQFSLKIALEEHFTADWNNKVLKDIAIAWNDKEFNLTQLPLMEIKLVRLMKDQHLLLFNMHHIIGDGWSIEIMLKELIFFYNTIQNHSDETLEPLNIQFKDYVLWQNNLLQENQLLPVKDYWLEKLKKPRPLLNLPADFKRTEILPLNGNLLHFRLGKEVTGRLSELGAGRNASLFMTLLSAVYILLYKYTRQEDILIGSPVAGRQHYDLENQIGFFINTVVLRNHIDSEKSYLEFLQEVIQMMNEAFDNQIYPFDKLVDELDVERLQNRNPLFDVMVAWMVRNGMEMSFEFNGIQVDGIEFPITRSMFDLTFLFEESNDEVLFSIEYNTALFRQDRIERMAAHFRQLTENILSNPEEKIQNLSILPENEQNQLLVDFNESNNLQHVDTNVIGLFSQQVVNHPQRTALVYGNRKLSYSDLDLLSNGNANFLVNKVHPGQEDIIAVMTEDPVLSVIALLGVMKTGAAYMPLSSDHPAERLASSFATVVPKQYWLIKLIQCPIRKP